MRRVKVHVSARHYRCLAFTRKGDDMIAVAAGACYFAMVFALAFMLGVLRTLLLQPLLGDVGSVLVELPIVLLFAWWAARWLIGRFNVPPKLAPRLAMGATAFALLIAVEAGLAVILFNRSLAEHVARYRLAPDLLGLAGQLVFGLIPVLSR